MKGRWREGGLSRVKGRGLVESMGFFFFKQKTAYEIVDCDWSSDVCSSDLMMDRKFRPLSNSW